MPEPWELTKEEAAEEGARLEERRRAADREGAGLLSRMIALLEATDEELDALPPEEAEYVREYRRREEEIDE